MKVPVQDDDGTEVELDFEEVMRLATKHGACGPEEYKREMGRDLDELMRKTRQKKGTI